MKLVLTTKALADLSRRQGWAEEIRQGRVIVALLDAFDSTDAAEQVHAIQERKYRQDVRRYQEALRVQTERKADAARKLLAIRTANRTADRIASTGTSLYLDISPDGAFTARRPRRIPEPTPKPARMLKEPVGPVSVTAIMRALQKGEDRNTVGYFGGPNPTYSLANFQDWMKRSGYQPLPLGTKTFNPEGISRYAPTGVSVLA